MEEKKLSIIKETVEEVLGAAGFQVEATIENSQEKDQENIICNIETGEDSNFLIGQYGVNLQALQHIIRLIIRKKISEERVKFILDVNSYRQQKNASIIELAVQAADQAVNEGRAVVLKPMSSYERRVVHMELSNNKAVSTESIGEGEDRKIVIKPEKSL